MADYNPVQTVAPPTASPDNLLSTRASPEAFGSQVGQATQKLGATGEEYGNQQMAVVMQLQQMSNENTANTATMGYADFVGKQEMALKQNQGQNAADAFPQFQKSLSDQMATQASKIQSPVARNAFMQDARNFYDRSMYSAGSYVGDEVRKGVDQSDEGKIRSYINSASSSFNVPGAVDKSIQDVTTATIWNAHEHKGIRDSDTINALVQKNVGDLLSATTHSIMNSGGSTLQGQARAWKQAQDFFDKYKDATIPDSPGVPVLGSPFKENLGAALNYKEYTLNGRQDTETAHDASETVWNGALQDFNKNMADHPPKPGEDAQSFVDYIEQNKNRYQQQARDLGTTLSGRSLIGDSAASFVETRMSSFISNENERDKINVNKLQTYLFEGKDGMPFSSERDLTNGPPEIQQAWQDTIDRRPAVARTIRKNLLAANAAGKQLTYGTDFWNHFEDMTKKLETSAKPTSEYYMHFVGPTVKDPLTNTGFQTLDKEREYAMSSPEGAAFVHLEKQYFEGLRTGIVGNLLIRDPDSERIFNNAMVQGMKKIQKGRDAGLTADQLFDPNSKDYVGGVKAYDGRSPAQQINALINAQNTQTLGDLVPHPAEKFDIKKVDAITDKTKGLEELHKAVSGKSMTPKEARDYALKRQWGTVAGPEVKGAQ